LVLKFRANPGFPQILMELILSNDVDMMIRQSGAVHLKQIVEKNWEQFHPNIKDFFKSNFVQLFTISPKLIRVNLEVILEVLLKYEFPEKWSNLIQQLHQMVMIQEPVKIQSALIIIRILMKTYGSATNATKQGVLNGMVDALFPVLVQLFKYISQQDTLQSCEMQLLLIKIFWFATQVKIPSYLTVTNLTDWLNTFVLILQQPLPINQNLPPEMLSILDVKWKLKKWIMRIFDRIFHRYDGNKEEGKDVAKCFKQNYSLQILEISLNLLVSPKPQSYPTKVTTSILNYVITSIYPAYTWNIIKQHMVHLVENILFPLMLLTARDAELYSQDPNFFFKKTIWYIYLFCF